MKKKTIVKVLTTLYEMCAECGDCDACYMKNVCILDPVIDFIPSQKIELISDIIKERIDKEKNNA